VVLGNLITSSLPNHRESAYGSSGLVHYLNGLSIAQSDRMHGWEHQGETKSQKSTVAVVLAADEENPLRH